MKLAPEAIGSLEAAFTQFHRDICSAYYIPPILPQSFFLSLLSEDGGKFYLNILLHRQPTFARHPLVVRRSAVVMSPAVTELARTYDPSALSLSPSHSLSLPDVSGQSFPRGRKPPPDKERGRARVDTIPGVGVVGVNYFGKF